jgi:hypothetical protein
MAMSPRKMMAMGKSGDKKAKPAVKLRGGGMVAKMAKGGSAKAPKKPTRPTMRPDDLMEGEALRRGERQDRLEQGSQNEDLRGKRRMRMGGMVSRMRKGGMAKKGKS